MFSARVMLRVGKYRGVAFEEVAQRDRSYCAWVLREQPHGLKKFYKYLVETHGGLLHIGKHRGKYFDEVMLEDEDYADWVLSLRGDPGGFKQLIAYMVKNPPVDEPPPSKRQRADEETCKICFQEEVNTVLVPCGHIVACSKCAERLQEKPCPICKSGVCFVQKTFRA